MPIWQQGTPASAMLADLGADLAHRQRIWKRINGCRSVAVTRPLIRSLSDVD